MGLSDRMSSSRLPKEDQARRQAREAELEEERADLDARLKYDELKKDQARSGGLLHWGLSDRMRSSRLAKAASQQAREAELEEERADLDARLKGYEESIADAGVAKNQHYEEQRAHAKKVCVQRAAQLRNAVEEQIRAQQAARRQHHASIRALREGEGELALLQTWGLEPADPRLLLEVWACAPRVLFLGEQWLSEAEVSGTNRWQSLSLAPRMLLSRPAAGKVKSSFNATELGSPRRPKLQVQFRVSVPKPRDQPQCQRQGRPQITLRKFKVAYDSRGDCDADWKDVTAVVLCLWQWGGDASGGAGRLRLRGCEFPTEVTSLERSRLRLRGSEFPATVATSLERPKASALLTRSVADKPEPPKPTTSWTLEAVHLSPSEFGDELETFSKADRRHDFELVPGGEPQIVGRMVHSVKTLLRKRDDLLRCISRSHLELKLDEEGTGIMLRNLSPNPTKVRDQILYNDGVAGPLYSGDEVTFMSSADATPSSKSGAAIYDRATVIQHPDHSSTRILDNAQNPDLSSTRTVLTTGVVDPTAVTQNPDPFAFQPLAPPSSTTEVNVVGDGERRRTKDTRDPRDTMTLGAGIGEWEKASAPEMVPFLTVRLCERELESEVADEVMLEEEAPCCSNGHLCVGSGGDIIVRVVDPAEAPHEDKRSLYCRPCYAALHAQFPGLTSAPLPQTLPARWALTFESEPAVARARQLQHLHGWAADVPGDAVTPWYASAPAGGGSKPGPHDVRALEQYMEAATLEAATLKARIQAMLREHMHRQRSLANASVHTTGENVAVMPDASDMTPQHMLTAAASDSGNGTDASANDEVEKKPKMPADDQLNMIGTAAEPIEPPSSSKLELANHQRFLRCLREGRGLIYRDTCVEAFAIVHAPANGSSQGPSHCQHLRAGIEIRLQPRKVAAASDANDESTSADASRQSHRPSFRALRVDCRAVDHSALALTKDWEQRSDDADAANGQPGGYSMEFELIEGFFSGHPVFVVEARHHDNALAGMQEVKHHTCEFRLPLSVATFLKPLPVETDFEAVWNTPGLAAAQFKAPNPLAAIDDHPAGSSFPASVAMVRPAPDSATPGSDSELKVSMVRAALRCGEVLQLFPLAGGMLGLGGELPAHGCVHDAYHVLVRVSQGTDAMWELDVRSQERRLAEALGAVLVSQVKGVVTKAPGTMADSPGIAARAPKVLAVAPGTVAKALTSESGPSPKVPTGAPLGVLPDVRASGSVPPPKAGGSEAARARWTKIKNTNLAVGALREVAKQAPGSRASTAGRSSRRALPTKAPTSSPPTS